MQFGLREHLATVFRHRWKIALVFIGSAGSAAAFAFLSSQVYIASARVLILDRDPVQIVVGQGDAGLSVNPQEQVLTQVEIVESPQIAEAAALRIGPERVAAALSWRWDWLRQLPRLLRQRLIDGLASFGPTRSALMAIGWRPSVPAPPDMLAVARERIAAHLFTAAIPKTDMFAVAVEAPDPAFAALLANEIVAAYVEYLATLRSPTRTAQLAAAEADRLEAELRMAEERAQRFAETHGIVSLASQKELLLGRINEAAKALTDAEREKMEAAQKLASIRAQVEAMPAEGPTATVTRRNPAADLLIDRIAELEARARRFVPGSPAAGDVRREIDAVRERLRAVSGPVAETETVGASTAVQELRTTLVLQEADARALEVRAVAIAAELDTLRAELRRIDGHEVEYRGLVREAESKEEALRFAMQRREETAITERLADAQLSRVVPVGAAVAPVAPERPRRVVTLILGAVAGLAGGLGLAYALEFMRRTLATREEVEGALGVPTLASLLLVRRRRRDRLMNEIEMRRLVNALRGIEARRGAAVILVASARGGEGRSLVATRLAEALRDEGASALLLQVALSGGSAPPVRAIAPSAPPRPAEPGLPVAAAQTGPLVVSGGPADTLAQLGALLPDARERHHFVVIDPPPLDLCPEQVRILPQVDAVVLVVAAEQTPVFAVRQAAAALAQAGGNLLGVVLNKRRFPIPGWVYHWLLRPA